MASKRIVAIRVNPVNTLAQTETCNDKIQPVKEAIIIRGAGYNLGSNKALKAKAKQKSISQGRALAFIDIAKKEENITKQKKCWNTYHCLNKIYTVDGKSYGISCKNRLCIVCAANRTAQIINKYFPVLEKWPCPYFVTLTVKSCLADELERAFKMIISYFQEIKNMCRKRYQRQKIGKIMGIRALECNFNPLMNTYNPHLHLIVSDKEIAEVFIQSWLIKWGTTFSKSESQYKRRIKNKKDLENTIKYISKVFNNESLQDALDTEIEVSAIEEGQYNILKAMDGIRIFDRFGFNVEPKMKKITVLKVVVDYKEYDYSPLHQEWLNKENGTALTDEKHE